MRKRRLWFVAAIAGFIGLSTSATPYTIAQAQTSQPEPAATDRAFELLGPPWQCVTFQGNAHDELFDEESPNEITSQISFFNVSAPGKIAQQIKFGQDGRWLLFENGALVASAPAWTHPQWIFERLPKATSQKQPIRSVLTDLGVLAFRRDLEVLDSGTWRTVDGETCKRASQ